MRILSDKLSRDLFLSIAGAGRKGISSNELKSPVVSPKEYFSRLHNLKRFGLTKKVGSHYVLTLYGKMMLYQLRNILNVESFKYKYQFLENSLGSNLELSQLKDLVDQLIPDKMICETLKNIMEKQIQEKERNENNNEDKTKELLVI
jgi:predicted transcriptional regulator